MITLVRQPREVTNAGTAPDSVEGPSRARRSVVLALVPLGLLAVVTPVTWFPWRQPLLTLLILPLIPLAVLMSWRLRARVPLRSGLEAPLVYVLLATSVATIPIADWQLGLPKVLGMALGASALLIVSNVVTSVPSLHRAIIGVAGLALTLSAVGLVGVEWIVGKFPIMDPLYAHLPVLVRGVVPNTVLGGIQPNELAGTLVLLIPVLLAQPVAYLASGPERARAYLAGIAGGVGLTALCVLLLTQSRSGIGGMSVALALYGGAIALCVARSRRAPLVCRVGVPLAWLSAVALGAWGGWQLAVRWLSPANGTDVLNTLDFRMEMWDRAGYMIQDFAFTGIGLGQFNPVLHGLYVPFLVAPETFVPHAHNVFLEYALELGIPGAVAYGALVVAFFRLCWRASRASDRTVQWTALGLGLGLIGFLVYGLTDAIAPGARAGLVVWVVLGLGGAVGNLTARSPATVRSFPSGGIS